MREITSLCILPSALETINFILIISSKTLFYVIAGIIDLPLFSYS